MIIWLASYPRSGNTYFRVLLKHYYGIRSSSIYNDKRFAGIPALAEVVGYEPPPMSLPEMTASDIAFFVKTHELHADHSPAIYLVRDGRDALVSYAHFIWTYEEKQSVEIPRQALHRILHDLIAYNDSFGGWGPHVLAWTERVAPTAIVKFEDLVSSPEPLALVSGALGTSGYGHGAMIPAGRSPSFDDLRTYRPEFFRRGKIGGWKDDISPDLHQLFWEKHGEAMQRMGYT